MISSSDILHSKILIVDDQEVNIVLLERTLRGAGYDSITSTTDPNEVCALHLKNRYELILLDIQMPGLDGFQVMEGLKEIEMGGYLPVLVITAQPDHKLRALRAGAKDFISKPFDLAEVLVRVYNMVEVRLLHLETKRLYHQVVAEQKVSERLLLNVLPYSIAERLKEGSKIMTDRRLSRRPSDMADRRSSRRTSTPWHSNGLTEVIADSFEGVTVLFADIVGFTNFSQGVSAEVLVGVLNDIFTRFDSIADKRGLEKVKTIGDAYMAAAGLPVPVADHTCRAAHMALDMIEAMDQFNAHNGYNLKVRIGINTGPVVAGVIGKRKFLYDLWGEVVNTASRMESHGVPGRIHVTDSARRGLGEPFLVEERGVIDVKSNGEMRTWFLNGRNC